MSITLAFDTISGNRYGSRERLLCPRDGTAVIQLFGFGLIMHDISLVIFDYS